MAIDERAANAAAAVLLGRVNAPEQEVYAAARAAITAYEAAKPVPPMSTSGEMVESVARLVSRVMGRDNHALAMQTAHEIVYLLSAEAASRIEALEALVAEQAGEIEKLRHIRDRRGDKIIELSERALSAEAALAKGRG